MKRQLTSSFLYSLLCVAGFGTVTAMTFQEQLHAFDHQLIEVIQGYETAVVTWLMTLFTHIGSTVSVVVLSALILGYLFTGLKRRTEALLFLAVVAGSGALNQILKMVFQRPRPELNRLIEDVHGYSFPSGHSMSAFALYGILTFLLWRNVQSRVGRVLSLMIGAGMILAIGGSRIYLGVHYPSDVIGGYLAGGFWLAVSIWGYLSYAQKHNFEKRSHAS